MSQAAANTFPCSNCGAKLAYDAGAQAMACPYCGAKQAVAPGAAPPGSAGAVREISLEEGLRLVARGYGTPVTTVSCKDCGASVNVGQGERTTTCAFCGSSEFLAAEAGEPPIRPESLLPFQLTKEDASKRFGDWLASLWFRPNDLKRIVSRGGEGAAVGVHEIGGVYVPFWTFSADVSSQWTAERGAYYYETEVYFETSNGEQVERTRQVQRTQWEPAYGMRRDRFDDVLVCAGRALQAELVEKLSSFDTKLLVPYRPEFLAGWRAESYAVDLAPAAAIAQQKMSQVQEGRCGRDVGGDTHRSLSVMSDFEGTTFKHVLLPVWVAAYRYNGKVYRFVVNGQTGEVVGVAPWSIWKIALLIAALVVLIGAIAAATIAHRPRTNPQVDIAPAMSGPALIAGPTPSATELSAPIPTSAPIHSAPGRAPPHPTPRPRGH